MYIYTFFFFWFTVIHNYDNHFVSGLTRGNHLSNTTPDLPYDVVPTNIACLRLSGKSPMGLGIPTLKFNIMLESNPLKSAMLVGRLGVLRYIILRIYTSNVILA